MRLWRRCHSRSCICSSGRKTRWKFVNPAVEQVPQWSLTLFTYIWCCVTASSLPFFCCPPSATWICSSVAVAFKVKVSLLLHPVLTGHTGLMKSVVCYHSVKVTVLAVAIFLWHISICTHNRGSFRVSGWLERASVATQDLWEAEEKIDYYMLCQVVIGLKQCKPPTCFHIFHTVLYFPYGIISTLREAGQVGGRGMVKG